MGAAVGFCDRAAAGCDRSRLTPGGGKQHNRDTLKSKPLKGLEAGFTNKTQ